MPKRKLVKPSEGTLALIKQVHERGIPINEEEALKIRSSVCRLPMPKGLSFGATISQVKKGKKGELRFWTPDHPKGPGKLEMPLTRKLQEMERDWLTLEAKRKPKTVKQESPASKRARSKIDTVQAALRHYGLDNRHAPALIAKKLNVGAPYVRKIRKQMRLTEGTV